MYVPLHFLLEDRAAIAELFAAHPFALLITDGPEGLQATHLPVLHDPDPPTRAPGIGGGRLLGHLSRGNPQCRALERLAAEGGEAMIVVQGPHAYVSPRHYVTAPAVPTWNYLALHAYGRPEVLQEAGEVRALLERMVATFEAEAAEPWQISSQTPSFLAGQQRGILAFALPIARLDAKAKLNQNRPPADRRATAAALAATADPEARAVAAWMHRLSGI